MKKRKIVTTAAVIILAFGILSTSASAATSYCQFSVGGRQCGYPISLRYTGNSIYYNDSHTYGGLFDKKICNYTYRYGYYNEECSQGHVSGVRQVRIEYSHTCGK